MESPNSEVDKKQLFQMSTSKSSPEAESKNSIQNHTSESSPKVDLKQFPQNRTFDLTPKADSKQSSQSRIVESLKGKIFVGRYTEKRYVEELEDYRDIIVVESNEEISQNLRKAQKSFVGLSKDKWVGITDDPDNHESEDRFLWVQISNIPLGKHWFQIKSIEFGAKEIFLVIHFVQTFRDPGRSILSSNDSELPPLDFKEIFTFRNFCEAVRFIAVLLMTVITIGIEILRYVGEYTLKFSNIFVNLVHVSTPICLGIFDFLSKCIGGLYWLIFVLIRGSPSTPAMPAALMSNRNQSFNTSSYKPLEYKKMESPRQPLEYRRVEPPLLRQRYSSTFQDLNGSQKKF
ncbi:hypothetical protein QAD02_006022 [Eretmocerus hayati]|uniref:Uncharacterized protein n=1 Tax=Eretmocerus hayati TaxID=131215 RepID=A0ACC2MZW7_9HYME|nr:hypothetical protein QAD02_006022 [Eretmocerus hayati]